MAWSYVGGERRGSTRMTLVPDIPTSRSPGRQDQATAGLAPAPLRAFRVEGRTFIKQTSSALRIISCADSLMIQLAPHWANYSWLLNAVTMMIQCGQSKRRWYVLMAASSLYIVRFVSSSLLATYFSTD